MMGSAIAIRSIQHYLYCKHRWGLLEIDRAWAENYFVTKANIMHSRVHDVNSYMSKNKKVFTAVSVYNDEYNLYGVTDCIEATDCASGVKIDKSNKKYEFCIVEYKPTKPKGKNYNEDDFMQVFAQKLCVDNVFGSNCNGVIYYADVKKRIILNFNDYYDSYLVQLKQIIDEMRTHLENGTIPPIEKNQRCSGCSLKDICMPKTYKKTSDIRKIIMAIAEDPL